MSRLGSALILILLLASSCTTGAVRRNALDDVNDFLLQLQGYDLAAIGATEYDLVVMDYSSDGSDAGCWQPQDIEILKSSTGGKIVLAYISIGEAEEYRFYWSSQWSDEPEPDPDAPDWLGKENPDWPGNYKVKYWHSEWRDLVFQYLGKIIQQGFDGVYMDIVDAYWYWGSEALSSGEDEQLSSVEDAASRMVDLIQAIAEYCRWTHGKVDFILCPQNGSHIINDASGSRVSAFWAAIDAIGAEDTFYFGDLGEDNPYDPQTDVILNLDGFVTRGKKVLATDYLSEGNTSDIDGFYSLCVSRGFVPFAASRYLDTLRINPGHEPD